MESSRIDVARQYENLLETFLKDFLRNEKQDLIGSCLSLLET